MTASAQQSLDAETETLVAVAHTLRGEGFDASEDGTGRGTPGQGQPCIAIQERAVSENTGAGPQGKGWQEDHAYTLEARNKVQAVAHALRGEGFDASEDGTGRGTPIVPVAFDCKGTEVQFAIDGSHPTLRSMGHNNSHQNAGGHAAVAFDMRGREGGAMPEGPHDTANIRAADGGSSRSYVAQPWAVRRLTPAECEALQGFPSGFTRIPYRNKPAENCPDGPRYKALGNSMAVPCMEYIGLRIELVRHALHEAAA